MSSLALAEVFSVASDKAMAETGGSHNVKGVEFQKHWAILRMFELEDSGASDFLMLFEAVQDIAVLDSSTSPTSISIYQVKKKDRTEWSWDGLTSLSPPAKPLKAGAKVKGPSTKSPKPKSVKALTDIQKSPIGKLYAAVRAFKLLKSSGRFISNTGTNLPLRAGGTVATALPSTLLELTQEYSDLLTQGLETLHTKGEAAPDLSLISIEQVSLPPDDPKKYTVGAVHEFLEKRSAKHAGQARALVDALLIKIAPLGAKTATCKTFNEMRLQHGYTKSELVSALGDLQELPDITSILNNDWLNRLGSSGMPMNETIGIRMAAATIYRRQIMGAKLKEDILAVQCCDDWLASRDVPNDLLPFFEEAYLDLRSKTSLKKSDILAHFALRAITKCLDQI